MNWSIVLGVAGIVITVVITLVIYYLQKVRRYPGRLSASLISLNRVLGERPEHYSDLSLKYGDYQIENGLLYVKLLVFNERAFDLKADVEGEGVLMLLPDNVNWVDVKVARQNEHVNATASMDNHNKSEVIINFDLLRKGESILVEGLIEVSGDYSRHSLFDQIQFKHRMPNVDSTEKVFCPRIHRSRSDRFRERMGLLYAATIIIVFFLSLVIKPDIPLMYLDKGSGKRVSLGVNKHNEIVAYPNSWNKFNDYVIEPDELRTRLVPDSAYRTDYNKNLLLFLVCGVMLVMLVLLEWEIIKESRRRKRLLRYLPKV